MSKHKKSSHKKLSTTEYIILATALTNLIKSLIDLIKTIFL